jgi:hypothetical protein
MAFTDIEEEIVFLKAVHDLIGSMVNYEVLSVVGTDPDSNIIFHTMTHQRFFNITLVDFLSMTDKAAPTTRKSYLGAMRAIAANPHFDVGGSVAALRTASEEFADWLNQEVEIDVWMPSINADVTLKLTRLDFLKMCGDISKHSFLRAVGVAKELQQLLEAGGRPTTLEEALLALPDFDGRFHTDILNYHASTIAEFLNNIRWGIYEYLQPEHNRSIVRDNPGDPARYRFTYPADVTSEFVRQCYWDLMNEMRRPPCMPRFKVTRYLKLSY